MMKPWLDKVTFHSDKLDLFQVFVLLSFCTSSIAAYFQDKSASISRNKS